MDRNVRAGAQAAMSLNNDLSSIEGIILASTEEPENLTVDVDMQCLCSEAAASCTAPARTTTAPCGLRRDQRPAGLRRDHHPRADADVADPRADPVRARA